MIIDCVGCLHGHYPELEGGDLLIVTGDLTAQDEVSEYFEFSAWLSQQKYDRIVIVAGNHDTFIQSENPMWRKMLPIKAHYLCDSGTEFQGLKIWGSPWSLTFDGINPHCTAFTGTEEELQKKWDLIPQDTEILITHCPPNGVLDSVIGPRGKILNCGSVGLRNMILDRKRLPNLKLQVFSHIHEWGGMDLNLIDLRLANCSIMDEHYKPVNKPMSFEIAF